MSSKSTPSNNDEEIALKKRKETAAKLSAMFASSNDSNGNDNGSIKPLSEIGGDFTPCSLVEIQKRMKGLMDALPKVLPGVPEEVSTWCVMWWVQAGESFLLLLSVQDSCFDQLEMRYLQMLFEPFLELVLIIMRHGNTYTECFIMKVILQRGSTMQQFLTLIHWFMHVKTLCIYCCSGYIRECCPSKLLN